MLAKRNAKEEEKKSIENEAKEKEKYSMNVNEWAVICLKVIETRFE